VRSDLSNTAQRTKASSERKWFMMKALVVYESMFGNTEQIARAVAAGLGESMEVKLAEVADAPIEADPTVELIVAGGPTHAFSMSRTSTRADAVSKGAHEGETEFGLREWLAELPSGQHREKMATFDTKIESMRHLPGSAAKGAAKVARRYGYESVAKAESFYVRDTDGPLLDGEIDRARQWGRQLAASIQRATV
jgi:flavodoxin-like protein